MYKFKEVRSDLENPIVFISSISQPSPLSRNVSIFDLDNLKLFTRTFRLS